MSTRTALALEIFGSSDKAEWSVAAVKLPRAPPVTLKGTKQISLSKKYFSIPPKYRYYYPSLTQDQLDTLSIEVSGTPSIAETRSSSSTGVVGGGSKKKRKRKTPALAPEVKGPGRPRGANAPAAGQKSILAFFKK